MLPVVDPQLPLPTQLKALREAAGVTQTALAERAGVSRLTAFAAEGKKDARLSTIAALFDALGWTLVPVPKRMAREVAAFVNNGGRHLSLPSGVGAPLSTSQRLFQAGHDDEQER